MESSLSCSLCHALGKCGRESCPYFTGKETAALRRGERKAGCDDHVTWRKGVTEGEGASCAQNGGGGGPG